MRILKERTPVAMFVIFQSKSLRRYEERVRCLISRLLIGERLLNERGWDEVDAICQ